MSEPTSEPCGSPGRPMPSLRPLAERYALADDTVSRLRTLAALLGNDPLAPTSVREPTAVRDDHLADALVALELSDVRHARSIADLGSGAGPPGLPLAAALPAARVALLEANARKAEFLRRAVALMGLRNAVVVQSRIEAWSDGCARQDVVTARALAGLDVVMEYAAPLLRIGGILVVWRGAPDLEAEAAGARAAAILGLEPAEVLRVVPYVGARHRHLHVIRKVRATPIRFPRRAGVARKRPLGRV